MQKDIVFRATGPFSMPENMSWYYIFLGFIVLRMSIVFFTHQGAAYIKNSTRLTEAEKKKALYSLLIINLSSIPLNLPLIGALFAYLRGHEILAHNWFLGTFQRLLNVQEREALYQQTVNNFLRKIEVTKEIQEQLRNWALENTQSFLKNYDAGSSLATQQLSAKLEMQKEILQSEAVKKSLALLNTTSQNPQSWRPWLSEKTIDGLNCFNPYVADPKACAIAWGLLIGTLIVTGCLIFFLAQSNFTSANEITSINQNLQTLSQSIRQQLDLSQQTINNLGATIGTQSVTIETFRMQIIHLLQYQKRILNNLFETLALNKQMTNALQAQINEIQGKINLLALPRTPQEIQQIIQGAFLNHPGKLTPSTLQNVLIEIFTGLS